MKIISTNEMDNGVVFNAKGDVLYPGDYNQSYANSPSVPTVSYTFNTDGTTSAGGSISQFTNTNNWVDTDGSDDIPVNLNPWIGSSFYSIEITNVAISGTGGTRTASGVLSTPGVYSLASARTANFTAFGSSLWGQTIIATYTYRIDKTANFPSTAPTSTFELRCNPQSP